MSKLQFEVGSEDDCRMLGPPLQSPPLEKDITEVEEPMSTGTKIRTTEEKKQLLGTMLGNVDALVDGVRKAGIWGLN
jgi:hypothetical protein